MITASKLLNNETKGVLEPVNGTKYVNNSLETRKACTPIKLSDQDTLSSNLNF